MSAGQPSSRAGGFQIVAVVVIGLAAAAALFPRGRDEPAPDPFRRGELPGRRGSLDLTPRDVGRDEDRDSRHEPESEAVLVSSAAVGSLAVTEVEPVGSASTPPIVTALRIRGRTVDASGSPVAGAEVTACVSLDLEALESYGWHRRAVPEVTLPPGAPTIFSRPAAAARAFRRGLVRADRREGGDEVGSAVSDADGQFLLSIACVVSAEGYPDLALNARREREREVLLGERTSCYDASPDSVADLGEIALRRCPRLKVTVRDRGQPLEGAWVREDFDDRDVLLRTAKDGTVVDYPSPSAGSIGVFAPGLGAEHYDLEPTKDADWDVTVELGAAASISGTVLAFDGTPAPRVVLHASEVYPRKPGTSEPSIDPDCSLCQASAPGVQHSHGTGESARTETDDEGRFSLEGLATGRRHHLRVYPNEDRTLLDQSVEATSPAHGLVISLAQAGRLVADVRVPEGLFATDEERETALHELSRNRTVTAIRLEHPPSGDAWGSGTRSDSEDGNIPPERRLFTQLAPGVHRVVVAPCRGLAFAFSAPVEVFAGAETRVSLELAPGRAVRGTVRCRGTPFESVRVWLETPLGMCSAAPQTTVDDSDGTFKLEGLPAGEAGLAFYVNDEHEPIKRVVVPGGVEAIDVELEPR